MIAPPRRPPSLQLLDESIGDKLHGAVDQDEVVRAPMAMPVFKRPLRRCGRAASWPRQPERPRIRARPPSTPISARMAPRSRSRRRPRARSRRACGASAVSSRPSHRRCGHRPALTERNRAVDIGQRPLLVGNELLARDDRHRRNDRADRSRPAAASWESTIACRAAAKSGTGAWTVISCYMLLIHLGCKAALIGQALSPTLPAAVGRKRWRSSGGRGGLTIGQKAAERQPLRPDGGVVTQRTANPCTPVQFRLGPPPTIRDLSLYFYL